MSKQRTVHQRIQDMNVQLQHHAQREALENRSAAVLKAITMTEKISAGGYDDDLKGEVEETAKQLHTARHHFLGAHLEIIAEAMSKEIHRQKALMMH